MSSANIDLGDFQYVYLRNIDCNGTGGNLSSIFQWTMPYIEPKQSPFMFIQVVQLYVDHDDGASAGIPQHLRYNSLYGLNSYSTGQTQLASLMCRDNAAGHWVNLPDSPVIQVPTNVQNLNFTIITNEAGNTVTLGTAGSIDIVLKIIRPKMNEIKNNILPTFDKVL